MRSLCFLCVVALAALWIVNPAQAQAQAKKPNILVIWGDDIGQFKSAPTTWG